MANKKPSIEELKAKAESGDPIAQNDLGLVYAKGDGIEKDLVRAKKLFYKSALQGCADAQFNLGWCYESGKGTETKPKEAFKWYRKASEMGHSKAQFFLYKCYKRGLGVLKDQEKMREYILKSAQNGYGYAQLCLGYACLRGSIPRLKKNDAYHWLTLALKNGYKDSLYYIGLCMINGIGVSKDVDKGIELLKESALDGNGDAALVLGDIFEKGRLVKANANEMKRWYRAAYDMGEPSGMTKLAECYMKGKGVKMNLEKAIDCYKLAAEMNENIAVLELIGIFNNGVFVPVNYEYVLELRKKLVGNLGLDIEYDIGLQYFHGRGVKKNYSLAFYWFSQCGFRASDMLALCYRYGYGTVINEVKSYEYMLDAASLVAEHGDPKILEELIEYYIQGIGTKKDYKEAYIVANLCHAMDHTLISDNLLRELKTHLSMSEIDDAEEQAYKKLCAFEEERDLNLNKVTREMKQQQLISDTIVTKENDPFENEVKQVNIIDSPKCKPITKEKHISDFRSWNVSDIKKLKVVYNLEKDFLTFTYEGHRKSVKASGTDAVFSKRLIATIESYYRMMKKEIKIEYYGKTISDLCQSKSDNYQIKNYVNKELRDVFGIVRETQVFEFRGKKPNKYFTTKMHIEVK